MSRKHPVIAATGSSGAGTTTIKKVFEQIFRREGLTPAIIEGDCFFNLTRDEFIARVREADRLRQRAPSHFGPDTNHFDLLEECFRTYGETGSCKRRYYIHNDREAAEHNARLGTHLRPGEFTPWEDIPPGSDLLFYEGLHGGVVTDTVNVARHVDLLIGVAPQVNLEWIQKIHRDTRERGYSPEAVTEIILRRMRDYVHYIVPQFSRTHINIQRVAVVDTSNPFVARDIPTLDESFIVIRFRDVGLADFPYYLSMIEGAFMSRPNTIVIPGGKMRVALEVILSPILRKLMERRAG